MITESRYLELCNKHLGPPNPSQSDRYEFPPVGWCVSQYSTHKTFNSKFLNNKSSRCFEVITKQQVLPCKTKEFYELVGALQRTFNDIGLNSIETSYLSFPHVPDIFPYKEYKGMKWSKVITSMCSSTRYCSPYHKEHVANILGLMGKEWAKCQLKDSKLFITIRTDPLAFSILGHLPVDARSCFKQCGANNFHKFILGDQDNSFVVFFSTKPIAADFSNSGDVIGRCWGFYIQPRNVFGVCNGYYIDPSLDLVFKDMLGHAFSVMSHSIVKCIPNSFGVRGIYYNKDSGVLFSSKENDDVAVHDVVNCNILNEYPYKCHYCYRRAKSYTCELCAGKHTTSRSI